MLPKRLGPQQGRLIRGKAGSERLSVESSVDVMPRSSRLRACQFISCLLNVNDVPPSSTSNDLPNTRTNNVHKGSSAISPSAYESSNSSMCGSIVPMYGERRC